MTGCTNVSPNSSAQPECPSQSVFEALTRELNAHLAAANPEAYDLVSTHTKYAPSQQRLLAPLKGFDSSDFFPALLDLAKIGDSLFGIPRNIDLRLLHYRTDIIENPPATWEDLLCAARRVTSPPHSYGYVFPGMESGLFGTFFELAESAGARIFPETLVPEVNNEGGRWALGLIRELYASGAAPEAITGWHYDEVHQFFRRGGAAMVADWPGYYSSYCETGSAVRDRFRVARMPAGPGGRVCCYAGSHTFALTRSGAEKDEAQELLRFLTGPEQQALEAQQGSVPVRRSVMDEQRQASTGYDAERLALLSRSIDTDLMIPPKIACYPEIENILWRTVRAAMIGELPIEGALAEIETRIAEIVLHAA